MLLTLATRSFAKVIAGKGEPHPSLLDLPEFTIRELQLRGLNVEAGMLAGWRFEDLDLLRDRADKAACPCLVLVESTPIALSDPESRKRELAHQRMETLAKAANRLACNAIAISPQAEDTDEQLDALTEDIRELMPTMERLELNLLLAPTEGLTKDPDRLIELIKQIGGFRIGSMPSFAHAAASNDMEETLRKLAPYAGAIHASISGFTKSGKHSGYDLEACVQTIRNVGFLNTLAIDYTGKSDPVKHIEQARDILQTMIEAEAT